MTYLSYFISRIKTEQTGDTVVTLWQSENHQRCAHSLQCLSCGRTKFKYAVDAGTRRDKWVFISCSGSFVPGGDVFHFLSPPLRVGEFNQARKKDYAASNSVFHIPIYFSIIFNFSMTTGQSVPQHIKLFISRNRTKRFILNSLPSNSSQK